MGMPVFLDLVETVTEDMVNAVTGTMAIHSEGWDYLVGMVCTVTVDMATITEAVMVDIILFMVTSMGDMVVTLKDILSHTRNIKLMLNLQHMLSLQPILSLKLILSHRPILKRIHL